MPNSKQIVYLSQSQYADLIANGTITVNGVTVTYNENDIYVTPQAEPVTDVRVNNASVTLNGVANIPMANGTTPGVVKQDGVGYSVAIQGDGSLKIVAADAAGIKNPSPNSTRPIIPLRQHESVYYGLSKAAGVDLANETVTVGTYPDGSKAAIQSMLGVSDLIAPAENDLVASQAYAIGDIFTANGKLYKVTTAIAADGAIVLQNEGETVSGANAVETSLSNGFVKKTDYAGINGSIGVVGINSDYGITINNQQPGHYLYLTGTTDAHIKAGIHAYRSISPMQQHKSVFYGLAKAAGADEKDSTLSVGQYTDNAKASIKAMLGIQDGSTGTVDVTGTTPTITAVENTRYVCGEVTSLDFTPAASGICIVRFTSGSTVTVLTLPSTVKFPEWFDPTSLETNTIYEICVTDGIYGAVMSWAQ